MHGTYEHRINCSLHPHQYYPLVQAAKELNMPPTVFVRDAALAYIQQKTVLPRGIADRAKKLEQENETLEMYLNEIVEKAQTLGRVTPREMRRLSRIAIHLGRQAKAFSELLSLIPHDH